MTFEEFLAAHQRIGIAGVGDAGKSTLANAQSTHAVVHTDDWIDRCKFADAPGMIRRHMQSVEPPFIVEGVRTLGVNREGVEFDAVLWMGERHPDAGPPSPKQASTAQGRRTNYEKWLATAACKVFTMRHGGDIVRVK